MADGSTKPISDVTKGDLVRVVSLPDVPLKEGAAAFEEVRAAVCSYSDAIFEVSGWGSPFTNVDEIEDDDLDDEADPDI